MSVLQPELEPPEPLSPGAPGGVVPKNEPNSIPWMKGSLVRPKGFNWGEIGRNVENMVNEKVKNIWGKLDSAERKILKPTIREINEFGKGIFRKIGRLQQGEIRYCATFPEGVRDQFSRAMAEAIATTTAGGYSEENFNQSISKILAGYLTAQLKAQLDELKKPKIDFSEAIRHGKMIRGIKKEITKDAHEKGYDKIIGAYLSPDALKRFAIEKLSLDEEMTVEVKQILESKGFEPGSPQHDEFLGRVKQARGYYQQQMNDVFFRGLEGGFTPQSQGKLLTNVTDVKNYFLEVFKSLVNKNCANMDPLYPVTSPRSGKLKGR